MMRRYQRVLLVSLSTILALTFGASTGLADAARDMPWLAGVTTDSVYVCLEATDTGTATVDFGTSVPYGSNAITENWQQAATGKYVHNIKLTGLTPNTQYHYRVRQGASTTADYTFWTAPEAGTPAHWAFGADSRSEPDNHNTMAGLLAAHNPRMVVYGGDLAVNASYSAWDQEWFMAPTYPTLTNQIELNATAPWVNAAGNHEGWNSLTKALTQAPNGDGEGGNGYFSFDYGDAHILVINNMVNHGPGSAQWDFAADDLAATDKQWKIVAYHMPAYASGGHGEYGTMKDMTTQIFEPNGVDMTLAGHSHFYQHNLVNDIHHMVIGSFGHLSSYSPTYAPYTIHAERSRCFGVIDTTPTTLTLRAYREDGSLIETIVIPEPATVLLLLCGGLVLLAARLRALLRRRC